MAQAGFNIASICAHVAGVMACRRMSLAMVGAVLLLAGPSPANAYPIGFQFTSSLDYGALAGTPIWGSLTWDDLGPGYTTAPIQSLALTIGNRRYGLSDGMFPAYVQSPHLDPVFGFANDWGPRFQIRPDLLIGGLTNLSLFEGGNVFVVYSYLSNVPFQYLTQATSGPVATVPEPGSLALAVSALLGAAYARRRRNKGDRAATPGAAALLFGRWFTISSINAFRLASFCSSSLRSPLRSR